MAFRIYVIIAILHAGLMFKTSIKVQKFTQASMLQNAVFSLILSAFWPLYDIAIAIGQCMRKRLIETMKNKICEKALNCSVEINRNKLKFNIQTDGKKHFLVSKDEYTKNVLKKIDWVPEEMMWTDIT